MEFQTTYQSYLQKMAERHITKSQEEAYLILLLSMESILQEQDPSVDLSELIGYLQEGEAGHHSKLMVKELSALLLNHLLDK